MANLSEEIKLHQRWALGEELTKEEQERLEAWYAESDAAETARFRLDSEPNELVHTLKEQISEMLQQISTVLKQTNEQVDNLSQSQRILLDEQLLILRMLTGQ